MTLEDFRKLLLSKSIGRAGSFVDDFLIERIESAMKKVATDTVPLRLVVKQPMGSRILRRVDSETYIRFPNTPVYNDQNDLDIDETLLDAVALLIMADMERANAKTYMGMYYGQINSHNDILIQTYLAHATHDEAQRLGRFP